MKVVRVVNNVAPDGSVAIGRGTVWGNPFIVGLDGDRDKVIGKFYHYALWRLEREPNWLEPLRGLNLACYCAPNPCHGNVLLQLVDMQWEKAEFVEDEFTEFDKAEMRKYELAEMEGAK